MQTGFHRTIWPAQAISGLIPNDRSAALLNVSCLNRFFAGLDDQNRREVLSLAIAPGHYYVDTQHKYGPLQAKEEAIRLPSNIVLDLSGVTIEQVSGTEEGYCILMIDSKENVLITNGTLLGDRATHEYQAPGHQAYAGTHEFGFGIDIRSGKNIRLDGMTIRNMTGDAVIIGGKMPAQVVGGTKSRGVFLTGCTLTHCRRQGVSIIGANGVLVEECVIEQIGNNGENDPGTAPGACIDIESELDWDNENIVIRNNTRLHGGTVRYKDRNTGTEKDVAGAAVIVSKGAQYAEINMEAPTGVIIEDNPDLKGRIAIICGTGTQVRNNNIRDGGIYAVDSPFSTKHTVIENNTIENAGIQVWNTWSVTVTGNKITDGDIRLSNVSGAVTGNELYQLSAGNIPKIVFYGEGWEQNTASDYFRIYEDANSCINTNGAAVSYTGFFDISPLYINNAQNTEQCHIWSTSYFSRPQQPVIDYVAAVKKAADENFTEFAYEDIVPSS